MLAPVLFPPFAIIDSDVNAVEPTCDPLKYNCPFTAYNAEVEVETRDDEVAEVR